MNNLSNVDGLSNLNDQETYRFGFVAIVGLPNVGKSTLLNQIVGSKIAITSRKPQTTRHRILGIKTTDTSQIVFVDTPGIHFDTKKALNRVINQTAMNSVKDIDLMLFMIDHRGWTSDHEKALDKVKDTGVPIFLLINKIDQIKNKEIMLPIIQSSQTLYSFTEIIPISALKKESTSYLLDVINDHLPIGPMGFPPEQVSNQSDQFMVSEFIREQVFKMLGQELPYEIAVEVTRFEYNKSNVLLIEATIWVSRSGQKPIVIGKSGQQLKKIGQYSRQQIERSLNVRANLDLWVKVRDSWADNQQMLRSLGYVEDS